MNAKSNQIALAGKGDEMNAIKKTGRLALAACLALAIGMFAGCGKVDDQGQAAAVAASSGPALSVLASSELRDIEPLLPMIKQATGVEVKLSYAGSIDAAEKIATGAPYDAAWLASNRYAMLMPAAKARVLQSDKTMLSPIVLGLRESKSKALGWTPGHEPSWAQISKAASEGKFTFGMTSPTASNTGFSALLGLATALSGKGDAVEIGDIDAKALSGFFKAHKITSGSSGWLVDAFVAQQGEVDGLVNYASSLAALNASGKLREPLALIYPRDGVATADYPLMLLSAVHRTDYQKVVDFVRSKPFQEAMSSSTLRRPVNPEAAVASTVPPLGMGDLPFPGKLEVVDAILSSFEDQIRRPTDSSFVVDISGSMGGPRIESLRQSLLGLSGADASLSGRFMKFRNRERVTLIPFDDRVDPIQTVDLGVGEAANNAARAQISERVNSLQARGGTAIYEAARIAYAEAAKRRASDPERFYSIVLMTDGENNAGIDSAGFAQWYGQLPEAQRGIKIFAVQFGEARSEELQVLATATGGKVFDSRKTPLAAIFKEIRGYQ